MTSLGPPAGDAPRRRWDFFLSYAPTDGGWAEWIAWTLEAAGYSVRLREWDAVVGTHASQVLQSGLAEADRTIAVLTPDYLNSPAGEWEWLTAAVADPDGLARRLVPVQVAGCEKRGLLRAVVSCDLTGLDEDEARAKLLRDIEIMRAGRAKPERPPGFPAGLVQPVFPASPGPDGEPVDAITPNRMPGDPERAADPPRPAVGPLAAASPDPWAGWLPRLHRLADLPHGNPLTRLSRFAWVGAVAFSADGTMLATGADDRSIRLWDVRKAVLPQAVARFTDHETWIRAVAFSPDGGRLATGGEDGTVSVRDIRHPTAAGPAELLDGDGGAVWSVAFSPRGDVLATADDSGAVLFWPLPPLAVNAGGPYARLSGSAGAVGCLSFAPDGTTLAAGCAGGIVHVWRVPSVPAMPEASGSPAAAAGPIEADQAGETTGSEPFQVALLTDHRDAVWALAHSPDGSLLATGSDDGTVGIWDLADPEAPARLATLDHRGRWVRAVAFSPDGTLLATGGDGNIVRLWDLRRPDRPVRVTAARKVGGKVLAAAFSPTANLLVIGCGDGRARIFAVP